MEMPLPFIRDRFIRDLHMHTCWELQITVWPGDTFVASIIGNVMALFHREIGRQCDTPPEPYDEKLQQGHGANPRKDQFTAHIPQRVVKSAGSIAP